MNETLNYVLPLLLSCIGGFIVRVLLKLLPYVIDFIVAKIGLTNYQRTKLVAADIWHVVEEHFRINEIISDTVQAKVTMFETLIKQKIPGITDEEINTIRQALAGEFNKDKRKVVEATSGGMTNTM